MSYLEYLSLFNVYSAMVFTVSLVSFVYQITFQVVNSRRFQRLKSDLSVSDYFILNSTFFILQVFMLKKLMIFDKI